MITTDSRGVTYDHSLVRAHRRHSKLTVLGAGSSIIIERVGPRPVDLKRASRKGMSNGAKRANARNREIIVNPVL